MSQMTPEVSDTLTSEQWVAFFISAGAKDLHMKFVKRATARGITPAEARAAAEKVVLLVTKRVAEGCGRTYMTNRTWLFKCAMREAIRLHKKNVRRQQITENVKPRCESNKAESLSPQAVAMDQALAQLSPDDRELLTLRCVDDHTMAETAGRMGMKPWKARRRIEELLNHLRGAFLAALAHQAV